MTVDRFELPERACLIQAREWKEIERQTELAITRMESPRSVLDEFCGLMSLRQRYMAAMGEYYSVQQMEGILVVDHLDEQLLRSMRRIAIAYAERMKNPIPGRASEFLQRTLPASARTLPQYPVAYSVLFVIREAMERFPEVLEQADGVEEADLQRALIDTLQGMISRYIRTRELPVQRHFSEVEREYMSVSRLRCKCGEEKFEVVMQALHAPDGHVPYDQLDLQCSNCGYRRTITFDLPHFQDMNQL
jgi:hypothetical protein